MTVKGKGEAAEGEVDRTSMTAILSSHYDFMNEKTLLQELVEAYGYMLEKTPICRGSRACR